MKKLAFLVAFFVCMFTANAQFKINQKVLDGATKVVKAVTVTDAEIAQYAREYIDWMDTNNPVCSGDEYDVRLKKLISGLERHDGLNLNFKVYYVTDVNAFACADGSIRICAGLMDVMDDNEVLGVIGHEIGHVKNNDIKDAFKNALLTSALRDGLSSQGGKVAKLTNSQYGDLAEAFSGASFSQKQENAADDYGYKFLKECGKNPWAMAMSFEKLNAMFASESDIMQQLFSTHPDTAKRAQRMAEKATKDGFARP